MKTFKLCIAPLTNHVPRTCYFPAESCIEGYTCEEEYTCEDFANMYSSSLDVLSDIPWNYFSANCENTTIGLVRHDCRIVCQNVTSGKT